MYRTVFCNITLLLATALLSACGQSGALMLPSDPNYDKRSNYLLHSDSSEKEQQPTSPTPLSSQE